MTEREQLEQAIAVMEAQRPMIGDAAADAAIAAFREKLAALEPVESQCRQVTVLFAEVSGLEEHEADRNLEEVRDLSARLWKRLDVILARFGGRIDKRSGSAVMAIFGATAALADSTAREDDGGQAIRAALEMLAETRRYAASESLPNVQLRAGINSGPVLPGAIGADREYTAPGDTVNVAGRLIDTAKPGEILISQTTFRSVRGIFDIQSLAPVQIKDRSEPAARSEPVQVYLVRGMRPRALRLGPHGIGVSVTVGRDAELAALEALFDQVVEKRVLQMVTVAGDAGIGKSRLLHELLRRLDGQGRSFMLFRGRGDPSMNYLPHALLRELLSFRFKILDSDSPAVARAKLIHGVEDWLGSDGEEAAHWIGQLAGFDFSFSPYLAGQINESIRSKSLTLSSLRRFLSAAADHTPLLIVVDDLQWADDGSLDGLEALARVGITGPALLIGAARNELWERRPNWGSHVSGHHQMNLAPLSGTDSTMLAGHTLRSALIGVERTTSELITLPARLIDRIVENSAGNPFFIEELVQGYLEHGVLITTQTGSLAGSETGWRVDMARLASLRTPGSLAEAVLAHLDGLPAPDRAAIQRAAVVGQVFWDDTVRTLLEAGASAEAGAPAESGAAAGAEAGAAAGAAAGAEAGSNETAFSAGLAPVLLSLQSRGLIIRRDTSAFENSEEYIFRNAGLHEVALQSIPADQRAKDHQRVAEWLVQHSGERSEIYASAIAGHYDQAGVSIQAAEWYGRAALQAQQISAPEAAVRFYNRALEILPDDVENFARRTTYFAGLWDVQWWQGHYDRALETAKRMLSAAAANKDEGAQAAAWNRIASVFIRLGDLTSALRSIQSAERTARRAGAAGEVVKALFNRGTTLYKMGNEAGALEAGEEALAFSQSLLVDQSNLEAARESARILSLLGTIHQRSGRLGQAEQDFRGVLDVYRVRNDQPGILAALNNLGENAILQGDYSQAAGFYQEAVALARQLEYKDLEVVSLNGLAGAQVELGDYRQAEEALRLVLRRAQGHDWLPLSDVYRNLAGAYLGLDRLKEALEAAQQSLRLANEGKLQVQIGLAWRMLGRITTYISPEFEGNIVEGKRIDPHACYVASLQIFVEQSQAAEQARTIREWALYELETGDRREGIRMWKEAREVFSRLGLSVEVERMDRRPVARTGSLTPPV